VELRSRKLARDIVAYLLLCDTVRLPVASVRGRVFCVAAVLFLKLGLASLTFWRNENHH
jgi:hypothetical protein